MAVPLTADICARGIIAAARYLKFDPIRAMEAKRGAIRSPVVAAALAAQRLAGVPRIAAGRMFGVLPGSISRFERESTKAYDRATAAASQAMVAAGLNLSEVEIVVPERRTRPVPPRRVGTTVAPPPAAPEASSPATPKVDHRPAIAEALARHRAKVAGRGYEVVGVEADEARIGAGGCCWPPKGVVSAMDDPTCDEKAVPGRLFCVDHCRAVGQKDTPVILSPPHMPQRFSERQGAS